MIYYDEENNRYYRPNSVLFKKEITMQKIEALNIYPEDGPEEEKL